MTKPVLPILISAILLVTGLLMTEGVAIAGNQSQTLLRYSTGLIQTLPATTVDPYLLFAPGVPKPTEIKNAALLLDKRNPLPPLTSMGGNYAFFEDGSMATVNEKGTFLYKGNVPFSPGALGGNYFLNQGSHEVIVVDSAGFFVATGRSESSIRLLGGNFYIDQQGVMTTIQSLGTEAGSKIGLLTRYDHPDQLVSDAVVAGGNYLEKVDGSIITVSSDGKFSAPIHSSGLPKKIGGNYFIGADHLLYTISDTGYLFQYTLSSESVELAPILANAKNFGYSYMTTSDGTLIFVDGKGVPHTQMVRISSTGIKSALVSTLKDIDDSTDGSTGTSPVVSNLDNKKNRNFIQAEQ